MGHDIIAGDLSDQQVEQIREALDQRMFPDKESFATRLDHCDPDSFVGHLRRSAFDPLNRVLYRALSAEHLYAGCSGRGVAVTYTRVDIKAAYDAVPGIVADQPPAIDTTEADAMYEHIRTMMPHSEFNGPDHDPAMSAGPGVEEEREFLNDILMWMMDHKTDHVRIYFG